MALVNLALEWNWAFLCQAIPEPLTDWRHLQAVDESINPKSVPKVVVCQNTFGHVTKTNQCQFPWAITLLLARLYQDHLRTLVFS
jgi:hypothetical protein